MERRLTMQRILCRVGYCAECALWHRPSTGDIFVAYGSTSKDFKVMKSTRNGLDGYVPHIYMIGEVIGRSIVIFKSCAMYHCGVNRKWKGDRYHYHIKEWQRDIMSAEQWNQLINYKDDASAKLYRI